MRYVVALVPAMALIGVAIIGIADSRVQNQD